MLKMKQCDDEKRKSQKQPTLQALSNEQKLFSCTCCFHLLHCNFVGTSHQNQRALVTNDGADGEQSIAACVEAFAIAPYILIKHSVVC